MQNQKYLIEVLQIQIIHTHQKVQWLSKEYYDLYLPYIWTVTPKRM